MTSPAIEKLQNSFRNMKAGSIQKESVIDNFFKIIVGSCVIVVGNVMYDQFTKGRSLQDWKVYGSQLGMSLVILLFFYVATH